MVSEEGVRSLKPTAWQCLPCCSAGCAVGGCQFAWTGSFITTHVRSPVARSCCLLLLLLPLPLPLPALDVASSMLQHSAPKFCPA